MKADRPRQNMTDAIASRDAEAIRQILRESEARVHEFFRAIDEPSVATLPESSKHGDLHSTRRNRRCA